MNRLILFLLILLPFCSPAQHGKEDIPILTIDSLTNENRYYYEPDKWRFREADSPAMASPGYDDNNWDKLTSSLRLGNPANKFNKFNSVGWFRYHFIADSSITKIPLAIRMTEYGASEIYLDGKIIDSFGKINGKDSSIYYDPQYEPFILIIPDAGPHVLAVRYANFHAQTNYNKRNRNFAGFSMEIGQAKYVIRGSFQQTRGLGFIYILLFGIFISFFVLHLFLYLYYRSFKSNLYFSIFSLSLSGMSFIAYFNCVSSDPGIAMNNVYRGVIVAMTACFSLSGFINDLFSKRKLRFRIITVLCVCTYFLFTINRNIGFYAYIGTIIFVSLEAITLTIWAIYKKIKGAKILGVGVLSFSVFVLAIFILSIFGINLDLNEETVSGIILSVLTAFAILSLPISMSLFLAWKFANLNKDLKQQLVQVQVLSEQTLEQEQEKKRILENQKENLEQEVAVRTTEVVAQKEKIEKQHEELKLEKRKSDDLLLNILPEEVAEELKHKGYSEAKYFDDVTVLFTDFVDFTTAGENMLPGELVNELNVCFKAFDEIISKYNIEKIKTIGDAYMAVCGLPLPQCGHATKVVSAALEIMDFMARRKQLMGDKTFEIRIGIHSGSVVAGIVGVKKFAYDIWGDTVNTAARIEQHSEPGKINISHTVYNLVKDKFSCTYRGEIKAKNKGELSMYFVEGYVQ